MQIKATIISHKGSGAFVVDKDVTDIFVPGFKFKCNDETYEVEKSFFDDFSIIIVKSPPSFTSYRVLGFDTPSKIWYIDGELPTDVNIVTIGDDSYRVYKVEHDGAGHSAIQVTTHIKPPLVKTYHDVISHNAHNHSWVIEDKFVGLKRYNSVCHITHQGSVWYVVKSVATEETGIRIFTEPHFQQRSEGGGKIGIIKEEVLSIGERTEVLIEFENKKDELTPIVKSYVDAVARKYDIKGFSIQPDYNTPIIFECISRNIWFSENFEGSVAVSLSPSPTETAFSIHKNDKFVGGLVFHDGASAGKFYGSAVSFCPGDVLIVMLLRGSSSKIAITMQGRL